MKESILFLFVTFCFCYSSAHAQPVWEQTNGPYSGRIKSITKDTQGYLYSITSSNDLYRSKDNGEKWEKLSVDVAAIAFDKEQNCYVGSDRGRISLYDKDFNFIRVLKEIKNSYYNLKQILIDANSNIYVSIYWGTLFISTDKGQTWNEVYLNRSRISLSSDSNNTLIITYAAGEIGRSTNNGINWNFNQVMDSSYGVSFFYSAYNKKFDNFIAVGTGWFVYKSTDGGLTWKHVKDSIPLKYVETLFVDENGNVYIGGEAKVCRSTDGGDTWKELKGFSEFRVISVITKDEYIFCSAWDIGIIRYDSLTKSILKKNKGIINSNISHLSINNKGFVFASTITGIFRTTNEGNYWEKLVLPYGSDEYCNTVFCSKSGIIYASNDSASVKSTDEGQNWITINLIDSSLRSSLMTFAEADNGRIYSGNEYLYFSDDNGDSWQSIDFDFKWIESIAIFQNKYVFVGTHMNGVYFSEDEGFSFRQLPLGIIENYGSRVAFNHKGDLFVSFIGWSEGEASYRSTDGGKSFTRLTGIKFGVNVLRIDKNDNIYIASITNGVLALSKDNGDTWQSLNTGLIKSIFTTDICFGNNNDAYLGSYYNGVFKTKELTAVDEHRLNDKSDLDIYQNPSSDKISISFTDSELSNISIAIFNILGIEIKRFDEKELSGKSLVSLSTADFPSGVYFCSINSRTKIIIKNFVVVR